MRPHAVQLRRCIRLALRGGPLLLAASAALIAPTRLHAQATSPLLQPGYVDDAQFRDALRRRGLDDLLEQHLADTPPADEADAQLRRREELLAKLDAPALSVSDRTRLLNEAGALLSSLIEQYPQHPGRLGWQLELARDLLERGDVRPFDALLLFEVGGRDRTVAHRRANAALTALRGLREDLDAVWSAAETLPEAQLQQFTASGASRPIESLGNQAALLTAWAKLLATLSDTGDPAARKAAFTALLSEITEEHPWTQPTPGEERQTCNALLMASIAARGAGRPDAAGDYARQIISVIAAVKDPLQRKQLAPLTLPAILEQIRAMRDANKTADALKAVVQARQWVRQSRPDDLRAEAAVAFAERAILARQWHENRRKELTATLGGAARPAATPPAVAPPAPEDLFTPPEALAPLRTFCAASTAHRDALYAILTGALAETSVNDQDDPFVVQLLLGAAVADAHAVKTETGASAANTHPTSAGMGGVTAAPSGAEDRTAALSRLREVVAAVQARLNASSLPLEVAGEAGFLIGQAQATLSELPAAVATLCDVAERFAHHDRAAQAAREAADLAQQLLREPHHRQSPTARAAFVRAASLYRQHAPDSPDAARLQFFIGVALEQNGQLAAAADAYAQVAPNDAKRPEALLGRARCLRNLLLAVTASQPAATSVPAVASDDLAARALAAAREAAAATEQLPPEAPQPPCLRAESLLLLAGLLNGQAIHQPDAALEALEDFERKTGDCRSALGAALRERIIALRQLRRLAEARAVVTQYLAADPDNAGPVMARLLEAMREETDACADRGDVAGRAAVAAEAAQLAGELLEWSVAHPAGFSPQDLRIIRVWQARALLEADRPADALAVYARLTTATSPAPAEHDPAALEIELGQAECRLRLGQEREALPELLKVWGTAPPGSPLWWRAFIASLQAHTHLGAHPRQIIQSIQQQRHLHPDGGAPRWKRALDELEQRNQARAATQPG